MMRSGTSPSFAAAESRAAEDEGREVSVDESLPPPARNDKIIEFIIAIVPRSAEHVAGRHRRVEVLHIVGAADEVRAQRTACSGTARVAATLSSMPPWMVIGP